MKQTATHSDRMFLFHFLQIITHSQLPLIAAAPLPSYRCFFFFFCKDSRNDSHSHQTSQRVHVEKIWAGFEKQSWPCTGCCRAERPQAALVLLLQLQPDISWTSCTCPWKNTSLSASNVKSTALLPIHRRMRVTHLKSQN